MKIREFKNIWDAIEHDPNVAASLSARSDLMIATTAMIRQRGLTQSEAAKLLGVTQPRVSNLMRGRTDRFSLDGLIDMAVTIGLTPRISFERRRQSRRSKRPTKKPAAASPTI